jgi:hypothetical protein
VNGLTQGNSPPWWLSINIVASLAATLVVGIAAWRSLTRWRRGGLGPRDRLLITALVLVPANAVVGFGYTKDVIMSTGGVCFALAAYAAAAMLLAEPPASARGRARMLAAAGMIVLVVLWGIRAVALPYRLEQQAAVVQTEWAGVYPWLERQRIPAESPEARALVDRLQRRASRARPRPAPWAGWRVILDLN